MWRETNLGRTENLVCQDRENCPALHDLDLDMTLLHVGGKRPMWALSWYAVACHVPACTFS